MWPPTFGHHSNKNHNPENPQSRARRLSDIFLGLHGSSEGQRTNAVSTGELTHHAHLSLLLQFFISPGSYVSQFPGQVLVDCLMQVSPKFIIVKKQTWKSPTMFFLSAAAMPDSMERYVNTNPRKECNSCFPYCVFFLRLAF